MDASKLMCIFTTLDFDDSCLPLDAKSSGLTVRRIAEEFWASDTLAERFLEGWLELNQA